MIEFFTHVLIVVLIYTMLAMSYNILAGYTGIVTLSHAAFYGMGAYGASILMTKFQVDFFSASLFGMAIACLCALVFWGGAIRRLNGDYFVIATLGLQMIASSLMTNLTDVTGGTQGIPGIPRPSVGPVSLSSPETYLAFVALVTVAVGVIVYRLVSSPFSRVLMAIREDEASIESLGRNTYRFKLAALLVSAAISALSGAVYAAYVGYIDPSSFLISESVLVISIVAIGGPGTFFGPIIGAGLLVVLPEFLRFVNVTGGLAANMREIIYGGTLVFVMLFRPSGLLGRYGFDQRG